VRAVLPQASERRVCRLQDMPRSSLRMVSAENRTGRLLDAALVNRIRKAIDKHPTFG